MAAALITSTIETAEWEYIDRNKGAMACWSALKNRHQSEGPIKQVQLLQEALTTQCTKSTPLPITADRICTAIDRAYDMGDISRDLLKCIALLGSLGRDFPHLRSIITRDISAATAKNPFTSVQLRSYLDGEQSLLNSDSKRSPAADSIALSARTRSGSQIVCTNCKRNGHTAAYCISPGGGMAGKTIDESKQARRRDQGEGKVASMPAPAATVPQKGKVSVKVHGADGRAYFMTVDAEDLTAPTIDPKMEFAGIAAVHSIPSDPVPQPDFFEHPDAAEYLGWLAIEEEGITALNASITPQPSHKSQIHNSPFWMDTGASVHISPESSDFTSISPIAHRSIKGLGGTSVIAKGIGTINLR
jgi:hypothetical protein